MKKNLLSLFVLAATMLIGMTASAQAEKASSLQTAGQEVGRTGLRNTLLGGRMRVNHQQAIPAKSTSQKARKLAGASYDVVGVDWYYDDYYYDVYFYSEDATYIFELKKGLQYGKAYTYADMIPEWVCTLDAEGYADVTATDATLTVSKDEAGLVHIVATMVLDGDTYNLKYDEKPFAPSGDKVNLNGTDLIGSYMPYYGMYVYQAKVDGNDIQLAFDATAEQATYTADQLIADYCIYTSSDYSVYVEFVKAASDFTVTTTETTKTLSGSVYAANGDEYVLNLVYEKPAPKDISINVQNATLTDRTKAGFWTIDGQTADKNNSFMLYFIGKSFEGTFTDVNSFDSYSTWVSDKSSGTNVYYENLSAVNLTSAVVGDSLVIEGTLALADSKGNPANVTLHVSTPFKKEADDAMNIKITSLTPAQNIDYDGTFKVELAYDIQLPEELKEDYLDAMFYYSVTCDGEEVSSGQNNAADINDGFVNFYVSNLQADKEYTLTVTKIEVFKVDWETFEFSTAFYQEGNIASVTFTISNATAINKVNKNKEQVIYNLNGMRLNKATKGINIINGKKFIVR